MSDQLVASSTVPPSLKIMTKEERARKFRELRQKMRRSKLAVDGKPGIHYFWGPKDDGEEMTRLDYVGYSITKEPKAADVLAGKAEPEIRAAGLRQDGTYVIGDVILMQCPEELYEMIMLDVEMRHEEMSKGTTADFTTTADEKGVPVIEVKNTKTQVRRE